MLCHHKTLPPELRCITGKACKDGSPQVAPALRSPKLRMAASGETAWAMQLQQSELATATLTDTNTKKAALKSQRLM